MRHPRDWEWRESVSISKVNGNVFTRARVWMRTLEEATTLEVFSRESESHRSHPGQRAGEHSSGE